MKNILLIILVLCITQAFGQLRSPNANTVQFSSFSSDNVPNLLLNDYPGASAAFSLMQLDKNYNDSVIVVRRNLDNASQSFNIINGMVDTTAIKTFVGGGDGFASWVYDWSGNNRHATQTTEASQPKIVESGILIKGSDSLPVLKFDGNDFLQTSTFGPITQPTTRIAIATRTNTADGNAHYITDGSATHRQAVGVNGDANARLFAGSIDDYMTISPFQIQSVWFAVFNTTTSNLWINNNDYGSKNVGSGQLGRVTMGSGHSGTSFWIGTIKLLIVYPSNQTTNRTDIEAMLP